MHQRATQPQPHKAALTTPGKLTVNLPQTSVHCRLHSCKRRVAHRFEVSMATAAACGEYDTRGVPVQAIEWGRSQLGVERRAESRRAARPLAFEIRSKRPLTL